MSSDRFRLRQVAVPVTVAAIMVTLAVSLTSGGAASGTGVETQPGTVVNLSGCTGFAIWESVLLPDEYCGITQDHQLISMADERPRVVNVIDVPGTDAQTVDEFASAPVMHRSGWGVASELGGEGAFSLDLLLRADTVCEGDSGAPALQGHRVTGTGTGTGIGTGIGGDAPPNSHRQNGLRRSPTCA